MVWSIMIAGFLLGAAGSLHCIGMCGPLSLALPTAHLKGTVRFFSLLVYQLGRVFTYSIIGLVAGLAGKAIYIAGAQQYFSLITGLLILVFAGFYFLGKSKARPALFQWSYQYIGRIISSVLKSKRGVPGFFVLGAANGLLPCGMVYIALLTSLSFSGPMEGGIFMAMFGMGTLPAMMAAAYMMQRLKWQTRLLFRRFVPFFMIGVGLLLLLRGLNLGIPLVSPSFPRLPEGTMVCHG